MIMSSHQGVTGTPAALIMKGMIMTTAPKTTGTSIKSFAHTSHWIRVAVLNQASATGWKHVQLTTSTDQFIKGDAKVTVQYGSDQVISYQVGSNPIVTQEHRGKLQGITTALGFRTMTASQKWGKKDLVGKDGKPTTLAELKAQAVKAFKIIEPAKA